MGLCAPKDEEGSQEELGQWGVSDRPLVVQVRCQYCIKLCRLEFDAEMFRCPLRTRACTYFLFDSSSVPTTQRRFSRPPSEFSIAAMPLTSTCKQVIYPNIVAYRETALPSRS